MKEWVRGHKHGLAVGGIVCCLLVCGALLLKIHAAGSRAIVLPQAASQTEAVDTFAAYQTRRDEERKTDRAALEKLLERNDLDTASRQDATATLARIVDWNEQELALEGALTKSRLSPCIAVRSEGMVTVVTDRAELSEGESALLLTLCETHCGVSPEGVKVICTGKKVQ